MKIFQNNVYILGYKSLELQNKLIDIFKNIIYDNSGKKNKNNQKKTLDLLFNWINEKIEEVIRRIKNIREKSIVDDNFREIIIYYFENFEKDRENIVKLFDMLDPNRYFHPFFVCLCNSENELNNIKNGINNLINENFENEKEIDKNNFSYFEFHPDLIDNEANKDISTPINSLSLKIIKKFIYIFSYYNELGDEFLEEINNQNDHIFSKINDNHEDNKYRINIICIGKSQRGKSTFINYLLKEKRAKEGGAGSSCSTKILKYKVDDIPLNIYDTIGVSHEKDGHVINELISKIKELQNQIKNEGLQLVLYFLDYRDPDIFESNEVEIFKQFCCGYTKVYYLFVCTKFCEVNNFRKNRSQSLIENIKEQHINKVRLALNKLCCNVNVEIINLENDEKDVIKEKNKPKTKKVSIIDYLYCCQRGIYIEEINLESIDGNKKLSTIINKEKNIGYINIIKCIQNGVPIDVYGMKNIINKMISLLQIIEKENRIIYDKIKKNYNENIMNENDLNEIQPIALELDLIKNDQKEENENSPLIDDENSKYFDIKINDINNILDELEKKAHKELLTHKVLYSAIGFFPFVDIPLQYLIKKSVIKKIAKIFEDNFIEIKLHDKNIMNLKDKEKYELIKQTEKEIDHSKSIWMKSIGRFITVGSDILNIFVNFGKISIEFLLKTGGRISAGIFAVSGIVIGIGIGAYAVIHDVKALIHFYRERLKYRILNIESFFYVIKYLSEFEEN